ncbi:Alpha/Beta hydrolase protein [Protomyces lactucae-debilis]|uniref:carboxypeptidase C n=1 Tax=Protomyces lactucae-debilis TaxID=2754530 RepID=A0A1Y2FM55_PROLT|nr:Alpha/Beta hydrolase protein [Protomyces lactucae-debilis]ORY83855.1 Alpha/Beta hydrolase protein [Protomyces lactucae-debilis]
MLLLQSLVKFVSSAAAFFTDGKRVNPLIESNPSIRLPDNGRWATQFPDYWHYSSDDVPDAVLHLKARETQLGRYCVGAGSGQTGYVSLANGTRHLYFVLFESRRAPLHDPLVLWLNGGPGCSSIGYGLLTEHGPCLIDGESTRRNKRSWNNIANMLYVDEPADTGYSFTTGGPTAKRASAAADDLVALIQLLNKVFPPFQNLPLHLTGESNAGKHLPYLAKKLIELNKDATKPQIPLASMILGNPAFDFSIQMPAWFDYACSNASSIGRLFNTSTCTDMQLRHARCQKHWARFVKARSAGKFSHKLDVKARNYCVDKIQHASQDAGYDLYDVRRRCPDQSGDCDSLPGLAEHFLRRANVRKAFGSQTKGFSLCNSTIFGFSLDNGDYSETITPTLVPILEFGLPILLYVGENDFVCNYIGVEKYLDSLFWSGSTGYSQSKQTARKWEGGFGWSYKNLVYLRVANAGHAVPESQPAIALELLARWLKKGTSFF